MTLTIQMQPPPNETGQRPKNKEKSQACSQLTCKFLALALVSLRKKNFCNSLSSPGIVGASVWPGEKVCLRSEATTGLAYRGGGGGRRTSAAIFFATFRGIYCLAQQAEGHLRRRRGRRGGDESRSRFSLFLSCHQLFGPK